MLQQGLYLMAPEVPSHPDQSGVVYTFPDIRLFFISCNVVGKMEATRVSSDGGCGVCQGVAWQQLQLQKSVFKKRPELGTLLCEGCRIVFPYQPAQNTCNKLTEKKNLTWLYTWAPGTPQTGFGIIFVGRESPKPPQTVGHALCKLWLRMG